MTIVSRIPRWALTPLAVALAFVVLTGAVAVGVRMPQLGLLTPFLRAPSLDYGEAPFRGFAPLAPRFIRDVLGEVIPEGGDGARDRSARALGPDEGTFVEAERITDPHPLTNDDLSEARHVPSVPFTARTDTSRATRESNEPDDCGPVGESTVWYRYEPPRDIGLIANTFGSNYATALGVFSGAASALTKVGCDTDLSGNALVAFPAKKNTTYYFQVTGPAGGGDLVFNLELQGVTTRASVSTTGREADRQSTFPIISPDGRFVLFGSPANTLAGEVQPQEKCERPALPDAYVATYIVCYDQMYVRDRVAHNTTLASVSSSGEPGDLGSFAGGISDDGRYVSFWSRASNLVAGDTNTCPPYFTYESVAPGSCPDVFVHDLVTRQTTRVSVSSSGKQANNLSGLQTWMSDDGRYVAFESYADNLVEGDTNGVRDVFVHDRLTRTTTRVSVSSTGGEARGTDLSPTHPYDRGSDILALSHNGRYLVFRSSAANLVEGDTNRHIDVFLRDLAAGTTTLVSVNSEEQQANDDSLWPLAGQWAVSDDGRYVAFPSSASNLVDGDQNAAEDLFVRDTVLGITELVTLSSSGEQGDSGQSPGRDPTITGFNAYLAVVFGISTSEFTYGMSPDGRYVSFSSAATNLSPNDDKTLDDVFLRDLHMGTTTLVSVSSSGEPGNGASSAPVVSSDGRYVVFQSLADNLVEGDTNDVFDIFVHERPPEAVR